MTLREAPRFRRLGMVGLLGLIVLTIGLVEAIRGWSGAGGAVVTRGGIGLLLGLLMIGLAARKK